MIQKIYILHDFSQFLVHGEFAKKCPKPRQSDVLGVKERILSC